MSALEVGLRVAGATQIGLAMAHLFFGRRFNWPSELAKLSLLNRQIFLVHCFFICLVLVLMGALGLFAPQALLARGELGALVAGGLAFFWLSRLFAQWFVYDRELWFGKRFETAVHFGMSLLWAFYSALYLSLFLMQIR
jgi:hypothetical protein